MANLRNKSSAYADPSLTALFMFNNLTYIRASLREDSLRRLVRGAALPAFEQQAEHYLGRYLESWARVVAVLTDASGDKAVKTKYSVSGGANAPPGQNFNKEFDAVVAAQTHYCVVDVATAELLRRRIKQLVLNPYVDFANKNAREAQNFNLDRQLKYDTESVEIIINRLFDVSY